MKKYAFNNLDEVLAKYLRKDKGFFVEIGAHDGVSGSNTKYLELNGWEGICVEANPNVFDKLKANRTCRVENVAVWKDDVDLEFLSITGYPEQLSGILESYDPRHLARVDRELAVHGGTRKIVNIAGRKLDTLVDRKEIDFLSIDTEGSELEILKAIDFSKHDIAVLCIENNFSDPQIPEFMRSKGYFYREAVSCDQIYTK